MSVVVCKLPKAGLGNQLFPLMNAMVFAHINKLPLKFIGYNQIKIGPYLRNEKSKRNYKGYFTFEKSLAGELIDQLYIKKLKRKYAIINEPSLEVVKQKDVENKMYVFETMPTYHDYFISLKPHRKLVIQLMDEILSESIKNKVRSIQSPIIGVHIRMGDFRALKQGEVFKGGHVRTPLEYFINIINGIRDIAKKKLPVSVFTDGNKKELSDIIDLDGVTIIEGHADIVDMLLLSKSKIIVSSTGSTFSYWAGFLSNAIFIKHPDHLHADIRLVENEVLLYEGWFDTTNTILRNAIAQIN